MTSYTYGDEILMDFTTANETEELMRTTISETAIALSETDKIIRNELLPFWLGGSATEFTNLYIATYDSYVNYISHLIKMADRLRDNIHTFDEMSQKLAG
jgi:hypothetical protein